MSSSFERSEIFKAPPDKILLLINNFESYKEFLPGCLESSRLSGSEEGNVKGRLVFSLLNKTYAFESQNKTFDDEIIITQSKGPFLNFDARWSLESIHPEKATLIYKNVQEIIINDCVVIPATDLNIQSVYNNEIVGFEKNPAYATLFFYNLKRKN